MYSDYKPCQVCGSEVRLRAPGKPKLAEADGTVDDRVCTNDDCPTNTGEQGPDDPRP